MTQEKHEDQAKKPEKIVYFIDKEKFETDHAQLSVRFLLVEQAKEDPSSTTLALKEGNSIHKYTNLDEMVPMKNGMKFVVFHNEPTPVSYEELH
jgi:hypothetical protein